MKRSTLVRTTALACVTVAGITALGACTQSSGGGGEVRASGRAVPGKLAPSAATGGAATGGAATGGAAKVEQEVSAPVLAAAKIRTAELTVVLHRGASLAAQADAAETIALRAGGEVDADDRYAGKNASATLVLRVPPQDLSTALNSLAELGRERSRHLSSEDVTAKVADVTSRVTSAKQAIARLRVLFAHASKITDVIRIEDELSTRESDLESLEAQQRALAAQTSTARITVSLLSPAPLTMGHPTHHRTGFLGGLENGWDAFTTGAVGLATALGAMLPFAAVALLLFVAGRWLWGRLRPHRPATAHSSPPAGSES